MSLKQTKTRAFALTFLTTLSIFYGSLSIAEQNENLGSCYRHLVYALDEHTITDVDAVKKYLTGFTSEDLRSVTAAVDFMHWMYHNMVDVDEMNFVVVLRPVIPEFLKTFKVLFHKKIVAAESLIAKVRKCESSDDKFYSQLSLRFENFFVDGQSPKDYVESTALDALENMLSSNFTMSYAKAAEIKRAIRLFHRSRGPEYSEVRLDLQSNKKNMEAFILRVASVYGAEALCY